MPLVGRKPKKDSLRPQMECLAELIRAEIEAGTGRTVPPGQVAGPWPVGEFRGKIVAAISTNVASYYNLKDGKYPQRPNNIVPVLKAFYGDAYQSAPRAKAMLSAWHRASLDGDDPPPNSRDVVITMPDSIAQLVDLRVNRPTVVNLDMNLQIPFILKFDRAVDQTVQTTLDGQPIAATFDIGLSEPWLQVESEHWMPVEGSIFRRKEHPNIDLKRSRRDAVLITGPKDQGCVVDAPLDDEPVIVMERRTAKDDGKIALSVKVHPNSGIILKIKAGPQPTPLQSDVLAALFCPGIERDSQGRVEIVSAVVPR